MPFLAAQLWCNFECCDLEASGKHLRIEREKLDSYVKEDPYVANGLVRAPCPPRLRKQTMGSKVDIGVQLVVRGGSRQKNIKKHQQRSGNQSVLDHVVVLSAAFAET